MFHFNLRPGHTTASDGLLVEPGALGLHGNLTVGHTNPADGLLVWTIYPVAVTVAAGPPGAQTITAIGIGQSVAFGTAKLNQNIAASGISQTVTFGTAALKQNIVGSGIGQTVAFGTASIANAASPQTITAIGMAQLVEFGNATLSNATPAAPAPGAGRYLNSPRRRTVPVTVAPEDEEELLALCLAHYLRD